MTTCVDTFHGVVHRFVDAQSPCYCGKVIHNRRAAEREIIAPAKPNGSKTAPIAELLVRKGPLTISQIMDELHASKQWVKYATLVLIRARKVMKVGNRVEYDARNYKRSVAIYAAKPVVAQTSTECCPTP